MPSPSARPERSRRAGKTLTARELARFLGHLRSTGNFAFACAALGRARSALYKRRARDDLFDRQCAAAIAAFRCPAPAEPKRSGANAGLVLTRYAGEPQLRRPTPGGMTRARSEAFLATLAATGNLRFAARSIGLAASSIHARRRRDPDFARAVERARDAAAFALEAALLGGTLAALDPDALADEAEPDIAPAILGPIGFDDALRLLTLHKRGFAKKDRNRHARASAAASGVHPDEQSDEEVRAKLLRALLAFSARVRAGEGAEEGNCASADPTSEPKQPPPLPPRVRQL